MTNVEKLVMQMEFTDESRRRLALKLVRLEHLEDVCRSHHRRLPHQVQTAMRMEAQEYDIDAPAAGSPGLPLGRTAR